MDYSTLVLPVIEARIDWLTCTAPNGQRAHDLAAYADEHCAMEAAKGDKLESWGFQSYRGWQCGDWRYGWGRHGACVVVSHQPSWDFAPDLAALANHWSRIDYCVTVLAGDVPIAPDEDYWEAWPWRDNPMRQLAELRRNQGMLGGNSLTIGSRASAEYFRCYDKFQESRGAYPRGAWRWELELKREMSESHQASWRQSPKTSRYVLDLISTEMARYKLAVPWRADSEVDRTKRIGRERDADRIIRWLSTQVAPAVQFAVEARGAEPVLEALNLHSRHMNGA